MTFAQTELRTAIFKLVPGLCVFNGFDKAGKPISEGEEAGEDDEPESKRAKPWDGHSFTFHYPPSWEKARPLPVERFSVPRCDNCGGAASADRLSENPPDCPKLSDSRAGWRGIGRRHSHACVTCGVEQARY